MASTPPPLPDRLSAFKPAFHPSELGESPAVQQTLAQLSLEPHVEGGYFHVTDMSTETIASPYPETPLSERTLSLVGGLRPDFDPARRLLSSCIYYYLTPRRPQGSFHRNRSRIIHTLHRGRGRYVLIHPDGHIETYIVGFDTDKGERMQWIVEGGVWKASFLLGERDDPSEEPRSEGLLITETVVPGFEYADHEFLDRGRCTEMLSHDRAAEIDWLIKH
ncbi:Cupin, RmlC-type [Moelleriella libera RCEF 2490]|uniref:Cupin, RmlC-type n=1 Tax=Moelleriella libera RCEF 2490 TaxID=1081109 RepID=A0A166VDF9_9HYPO|nr:Cupin, RmlC-type [Moelleriella libera RCEF 2490]